MQKSRARGPHTKLCSICNAEIFITKTGRTSNWCIDCQVIKRKARALSWYHRHSEDNKRKAAEYRKKNADVIKQRLWFIANRDKCKVYSRKWATNNPDMVKVSAHRRRARLKEVGGCFTAVEWSDLKNRCGNKCLRCGVLESETPLTVDHVIPLSKGGTNDISNLQPLCGPCNSSKQANYVDYRVGIKKPQPIYTTMELSF